MNVFDGNVDLALGIVRHGRQHQPKVECGLPSLGRDFEHVIFMGMDLSHSDAVCALNQLLHKLFEFWCGGRTANGRLFTLQFRARQIEHLGGLHVRRLPEQLHQLRDIDETGEARVEPVARAIGRKFHCGHRLSEGGRPRIEMIQVVFLQIVRLKIPLHGEHLGHAVGDGRAGGKNNTTTAIDGLDMTHLEEHIECPFAGSLRQTGDARHFRDVEQVFEIMRLVHKKTVHTKFLKSQRVVFFVVGSQCLQPRFEPFLRLLKVFD